MKRAAFLFLLAPAGCVATFAVGSSASEWVDIPNVARPTDEVVRLAREVLSRQGYRLLPETPGALGLESDWDVHLSSHWKEGFRTKVEVRVERVEGGRCRVLIRDRREYNDNAKSPVNPDAAVWVGATLDEKQKRRMGEPSMRVRQLLKVKLEGLP